MPRDLQLVENNTITLMDPVDKFEVVFSYRTPTTDDRVRYQASRYKREGTKLIDRSRSAVVEAALGVLVGIRTGDFTYAGAPVSSNPENPEYREDWKELVAAAAGDLLFLMGHDLFEGRVSIPDGANIEIVSEFEAAADKAEAEKAAEEPIPPLASCSGE